jgi:hypothetical protein
MVTNSLISTQNAITIETNKFNSRKFHEYIAA